MRALASIALVLAVPTLAHADAIGGCPQGQLWQSNPVPPGAMHHGGGQCVPDPSASHGCSASLAHDDRSLAIALVGGAVLLRRRGRVRAR